VEVKEMDILFENNIGLDVNIPPAGVHPSVLEWMERERWLRGTTPERVIIVPEMENEPSTES
jgi:hypothetical protein